MSTATDMNDDRPALPPVTSRGLGDLFRTPLRQTMVLLWLIGAAHLATRMLAGGASWSWSLAAALGAVTAALFAGHFRQAWLVPAAVILGLAPVLTTMSLVGVQEPATLCAIASAYALLIWRVAVSAPDHASAVRLAAWVGVPITPDKPLDPDVHRSAFVIVVCASLLPVALYPAIGYWTGKVQPAVIMPVAIGTAFFWLAGWHYRRRGHSYALLTSLLCATWLIYTWGRAPTATGLPGLLADAGVGLATLLFALAAWCAATLIERSRSSGDHELLRSLYRDPLRIFALLLALAVAAQQLIAAGMNLGRSVDPEGGGVLLLAGVTAVLANHGLGHRRWSFTGLLIIALATCRLLSLRLAPDAGTALATHLWLVLAAIAAFGSIIARGLARRSSLRALYELPLHAVAGIAYAIALVGTGATLLDALAAQDSRLPLTLLLLITGAFPVLTPVPAAARWRGLGLPVLLTVGFFSLHGTAEADLWRAEVALGWGFIVWALGRFALPAWNARWPNFAVGTASWPWFGLVLVVAGGVAGMADLGFSGPHLGALSAYLFLMIRACPRAGFQWLAVTVLTVAGLAYCGWWTAPVELREWLPVTSASMFGSVLWLNVLVGAASTCRRYGPSLAARFGWHIDRLESPLVVVPAVALAASLALLISVQLAWLLREPGALASDGPLALLGLSAALAASFAHVFVRGPRYPLLVHGLCLSLLVVAVSILMVAPGSQPHTALLFAAGGGALLATGRWLSRWDPASPLLLALRRTFFLWSVSTSALAALMMVLLPDVAWLERLLVLLVLAMVAAGIGWSRRQRVWLAMAAALLVSLAHGVWLHWLPLPEVGRVLPWYALLDAMLAWALTILVVRLDDWFLVNCDSTDDARVEGMSQLYRVLSETLPVVASLSLLALVAHGVQVAAARAVGVDPSWLAGAVDPAVAAAGHVLLIVLAVRTAYTREQGGYIYVAAVLFGLAALYLRVVTRGLAPPDMWDTAILIGTSYALFALARLTRSMPAIAVPASNICMALPLLALLLVPLQLASAYAGATLLAVAVLYVLIRGSTGNPLPLYLGVLALNAAIYLWVPLWADRFAVFQLYILPAALSTLGLLHLHRKELKPQVLNGARLAAMSTLYAGVALDVFARPELWLFALALGLGLAGTLVGIALRVRAYLYTGVAFLVLNVGVQLLHFYPEQRLGRAILLIALGVAITSGMILFNVKREAILKQVRVFRADLATWS